MGEIKNCSKEVLWCFYQFFSLFVFFASQQPKSSVAGLLNEMTAKFEEEPPLSTRAAGDKDPHELLAFVSNLQINDGASRDTQLCL